MYTIKYTINIYAQNEGPLNIYFNVIIYLMEDTKNNSIVVGDWSTALTFLDRSIRLEPDKKTQALMENNQQDGFSRYIECSIPPKVKHSRRMFHMKYTLRQTICYVLLG